MNGLDSLPGGSIVGSVSVVLLYGSILPIQGRFVVGRP